MHQFKNYENALTNYLNKGAFLTSGDNIMTVSWGFIGVMWGMKVLVAPIRDSRFTKTFVDKTSQFALSIPYENELLDKIKLCGSKSGRDCDKWTEAKLEKQAAKAIKTYTVKGSQKYFECEVLTTISMKDCDISKFEKWYPTGDLHNLYFAKIVAEY